MREFRNVKEYYWKLKQQAEKQAASVDIFDD